MKDQGREEGEAVKGSSGERRQWTNADQNRLLACREHILRALKDAMGERHKRTHWVEYERQAVAIAANEWAKAHGVDQPVTVADVERIEQQAVGHVDYASKLALYVAEAVTVPSGGHIAAHSSTSSKENQ